jgi:hypothetical protein
MWDEDVATLRERLNCSKGRRRYRRLVIAIRGCLGLKPPGKVLADNGHWVLTRLNEFVWGNDGDDDDDIFCLRLAATGFAYDSGYASAAVHTRTLAIVLGTSKTGVNRMLQAIGAWDAQRADPRTMRLRGLTGMMPNGWVDGFRYRLWDGVPPTRVAELQAQAEFARFEKAQQEAAREAATRDGQAKRAATLAAQADDELRQNAAADAARHGEAVEFDVKDDEELEGNGSGEGRRLFAEHIIENWRRELAVGNRQTSEWVSSDYEIAFTIHRAGPSAYNRMAQILPLPSEESLRLHFKPVLDEMRKDLLNVGDPSRFDEDAVRRSFMRFRRYNRIPDSFIVSAGITWDCAAVTRTGLVAWGRRKGRRKSKKSGRAPSTSGFSLLRRRTKSGIVSRLGRQ